MAGGPVVETVAPTANAPSAPLDSDVSAIFDQDLAADTVSDTTFAVHAMQAGRLLQPENSLSVNGNTVTLNPAVDFKPGELIEVTATTGIENPTGQPAENPLVWQFRAGVTGGTGTFSYSGQTSTHVWLWTVAT